MSAQCSDRRGYSRPAGGGGGGREGGGRGI